MDLPVQKWGVTRLQCTHLLVLGRDPIELLSVGIETLRNRTINKAQSFPQFLFVPPSFRVETSGHPLINSTFNMGKPEEAGEIDSPPHEIRDVFTKEIGDEARRATEIEHHMTFRQGLKLYPKAMAWSAFFSLGCIMTAFDPQLLGSLYAEPAFQRDFGYNFEGDFIISAPWQTGLGMGNPIGQVVGALLISYPMEWWGRKWVSSVFCPNIS